MTAKPVSDTVTLEYLRQYISAKSGTIRLAQKKLTYEQFEELFRQAVNNSDILTHSVTDIDALQDFLTDFTAVISRAVRDIREFESILPKNLAITNSKLANNMSEMVPNIPQIIQINGKSSVPTFINATVAVFDDRNISFGDGKVISNYEKCVHDAICSLLEAGNEVVTPATVFRAMNGMTESESVSQKSVDQITEAVDKMRRLEVSIDFTNQAREYQKKVQNSPVSEPLDPIEEAKISEVMLDFRKVTVKAGGHTVSAYQYNGKSMPPIYAYSKQFKQIITIDSNLLNTKAVIRSTEFVIVLRSYLLQRIEMMKNPHNHIDNTCIKYDAIYRQLGLTEEDSASYKKATFEARQQTARLLDFFREADYIADYRAYRVGKKIAGVQIQLKKSDTPA